MTIQIEEIEINRVKPYENNPRINDTAVDVVADSIREFGWRQPIVVDPEYVVICRITSYNVCYTKLLRRCEFSARLLSHLPISRRSWLPSSFIAAG